MNHIFGIIATLSLTLTSCFAPTDVQTTTPTAPTPVTTQTTTSAATPTPAVAKDISDMIKQIKENGAKYVLYDTLSEKRIAETVASESGAELLHIHAIHNITKAEFDAGENYVTLMIKNIETLRKALS